MDQPRLGRPPKPLDPEASQAARLGAEIRARRQAQGLTQQALADLIGFSFQHISQAELATAPVSELFITVCDNVLDAQGSLLELLAVVTHERGMQRHDRSIARYLRGEEMPSGNTQALARPLGVERYAGPRYPSEADEDVDPLSRRNLFRAGTGATVGLGLSPTTAPAATREIDPGLIEHWMQLMQLLDRHGGVFGSGEVFAAVRRELALIAQHRQIARGELRTQLLRVESRWSQFASWLSHDGGDPRQRDRLAERALRLAREGDYPEMVAYVLLRRSRWAIEGDDARQAAALAQLAGRVRDTTPRMRALCALKQAHSHALANDAAACTSSLRDADALLDKADASQPDPLGDVARHEISRPYVKADVARCRLWLQPARAVGAFEDVLRVWPSSRARDRGVQQARLALACAAADEPDRAAVEGIKALSIARTTKSDVTVRELKRLDRQLSRLEVPAVEKFREAVAGV
jgi:transcriptional regulator with XRE-family HTH domain